MPFIEELSPEAAEAERGALAAILKASVEAGASVSFLLPFSHEAAAGFWDGVIAQMRAGQRRLLVARAAPGGPVLGTVNLALIGIPNQPHRAEVSKLLVHPEARRQGIARALMLAVEDLAREAGRSLLCLDTRQGDAAEPLYGSLGYVFLGAIPGFAIPPHGGKAEAASFFYKQL
ncbi:GNAT family N-acetyltransferase [Acetobacteraceae bacterium H6797]|nr:GNAT family N-acetyltransferase [Acetobacteraceae bacterium H6797]